MSSPAIVAEALSKQYRLGRYFRSDTLRDSLNRAGQFLRGRGERRVPATIWALRDVSFEIQQGEIVGVVGMNGAGKSTLLRILSRITEPTDGYADVRGRLGSLLEVGTGFHPELSGRDNIYLNGTILGMRRTEIRQKLDEIVEFAEIAKFIDTPVKRYSSGMYVRLAFSVAAHFEPDILIVDEALAVGDVAFQQKCLRKMLEVGDHGRTVLFVSHQLATVRELCQRAMLLESGRLIGSGTTDEILDQYLARFGMTQGDVLDLDRHQGSLEHVRFTRVELLGTDEGPVAAPLAGDDIRVRIWFDVLASDPSTHLTLSLSTAFGERLLTVSDTDDPNLPSRPLRVGEHEADVTLPGIFRAGTYSLGVGAHGEGDGKWWCQVPDAVRFRIDDDVADAQHNAGLLKVASSWSIDRRVSGRVPS